MTPVRIPALLTARTIELIHLLAPGLTIALRQNAVTAAGVTRTGVREPSTSSAAGDCIQRSAPDGVVCLAGVSHSAEKTVDIGELNRDVVLGNRVIFGSVNANRRHYEAAMEALTKADPAWLHAVITRRVPLDRWREAFEYREHDVKTVVVFSDPASV